MALQDTLNKIYGAVSTEQDSGIDYIPTIKDRIVDNLPLVPENIEEMLMSSDYKTSKQAKDNFTNAIIRRETGAVINDSEREWVNKTYFPQIGDSPQVQAQKKQRRGEAIRAQAADERDRAFGNRAARSSGQPETGSVEEAQIMQEMQGMSEEDQERLQNLLEQGQIKTDAPLADIAEELKAAGTGEDTQLAHLRPGEMVIPPEFLEDEQFESMLEKKYNEFNINPEQAVVGAGIASLNATTGLEEFGFFKKIGKSIKKVAKKIAPVAGP